MASYSFENAKVLAPDGFDFQTAVFTLRKYKFKIFLLTALMTLLVFLWLSAVTPVYRSTATLLINSSDQSKVLSVDELISSEHTSENFQTQIEVLRSRRLAQRIVSEMELTNHWEYNSALQTPPEFQNVIRQFLAESRESFGVARASSVETSISGNSERDAVDQLLSKLEIVPVPYTKLARIKVDGADPDLVTKIANQYGESYIDDILESKVELTIKASTWLDDRLASIREKLELSEANLVEFRETNGILDLGGRVGGLKEQQIGVLTERRLEAERERRELRILLDEINSAASGSSDIVGGEVSISVVEGANNRSILLKRYESLRVVSADPLVRRLRLEVLEEDRKLEELGVHYGEKHPLVVSAKANLDVAVDNLNIQIESVIDSIEKQYELSVVTVRSLESELGKEERATYDLDRQQIEMSQLEREVEANRNLYEASFKRAKGASEVQGIGAVIASVSDPATTPTEPVFPRTKLSLQLTTLLSLIGFSFLVLFIEKFRNTVQDVDAVISKLGLPMLGLVPLVRQKNSISKFRSPVIPGYYTDKIGLFEESFKTIRSSLYLASVDDKLIMVTSSLPAEGKSTVALNLAQSLSLVESVLLIEADMRRPALSVINNIHGAPGLSDYLMGDQEIDTCIVGFKPGNLDILPAGFVPHMPLELLTTAKFEALLTKLSTQYDKIIIDTPPVGAVSDALMVGRLIDTTVFVTQADSTQIQDVGVSLERLHKAGIKVVGVVISKVDIKKVNSCGGESKFRGYSNSYDYGYAAE